MSKETKSIIDNQGKFTDLPFINRKGPRKNWSNWSVPKAKDYGEACEVGRYYGACFLQYQLANPEMVGSNTLGIIAEDIDFKDDSGAKGYWVGFFDFIEAFSHLGAKQSDMLGFYKSQSETYRKIEAERSAEAAA